MRRHASTTTGHANAWRRNGLTNGANGHSKTNYVHLNASKYENPKGGGGARLTSASQPRRPGRVRTPPSHLTERRELMTWLARRSPTRTPRPFAPALETLEDRTTPSSMHGMTTPGVFDPNTGTWFLRNE